MALERERECEKNSEKDFLCQIEQDLNFSLPTTLKKVLIDLGYNCKLAWQNFTEQDIIDIETEAREYLSKSDPSLKDFKIFSGQRKILMSLSQKVTMIKCDGGTQLKTQSKTQSKKNQLNNSVSNPVNLQEEKIIVRKQIEKWLIGTTEKTAIYQKVAEKVGEIDISTSLSTNANYICIAHVKCVICGNKTKIVKTINDRKWIPSNFYKHFKTHVPASVSDNRADNVESSGPSEGPSVNNLRKGETSGESEGETRQKIRKTDQTPRQTPSLDKYITISRPSSRPSDSRASSRVSDSDSDESSALDPAPDF